MSDRSTRVLIVEDEDTLSESIQYHLQREGFDTAVAADGLSGVEQFREFSPDLILLDLMLPQLSGLDVCRLVRTQSTVPIIMLTAKDSEADVVTGLEVGADDYMTKPFSMRELVSRVRANLRRVSMSRFDDPDEDVLVGGPIRVDVGRHEVFVKGGEVPFRPKEFELLELFLRRKGRLLTRDFLIEQAWGPTYFGDTKTLDVHVKRIRQKVEPDPSEPKYLVTVRGLGYKFVDGD